ncbi:uncharacterized protein [Palaemon carinicauda]|uniref:uncharacterized protein n=1 Tax=Palaemon carinicauda TaxID=392227 RepID=UPI0035B5CE12
MVICRDDISVRLNKYFKNKTFTAKIVGLLNSCMTKLSFQKLGETENEPVALWLPATIINAGEINKLLDKWETFIENKFPQISSELRGSGWTVEDVKSFKLFYHRQAVMAGMGAYIFPKKEVRGSHAVFNPSGIGNSCLIQCLAAYFIAKQQASPHWGNISRTVNSIQRCSEYVDFTRITFPIQWEDISRLESANRISIYVYEMERSADGRYLLQLSRRGMKKFPNIVPLLLLDGEHTCLIKDFHSFVKSFARVRSPDPRYFCHNCLSQHSSTSKQEHHEASCELAVTLNFPPVGSTVRFRNQHKTQKFSYICVFDMESALEKSPGAYGVEAIHKSIAYCYIIFDCSGQRVASSYYCGNDCVDKFLADLNACWETIKKRWRTFPIHMTEEDERAFLKQDVCQLYYENEFDYVKTSAAMKAFIGEGFGELYVRKLEDIYTGGRRILKLQKDSEKILIEKGVS